MGETEGSLAQRDSLDVVEDHAIPFPLITLALDGTVVAVNQPAEDSLATTFQDLHGKPFDEVVGRSWRGVFRAAVANVTRLEAADPTAGVSVELPLSVASTEIRFVLLLGVSVRGGQRRISVVLQPTNHGSDVERTFHTSALEAMQDAILCADLDGRILYHNQRFCEMWELASDALPDGHAGLLEAIKDRLQAPDSLVEAHDRIRREPDKETRELLHFHDRRTIEQSARPLYIGEELIGHVMSFRDVTKQQRAQEVIRSSEQRYRLLFERNVAGVFRASLGGRILEVNDAFARMVGHDTPQDLQGKSITELYASLPERRRFGEQLERTGAVANRELQFARKDGSTIWVLENSLLVDDTDLMESVIEGTIVDITARKRLETELERMAYHDPLTDLANRRLLEERARMSLAFADRHGIQAGRVYLDLSRFKRINDTLGHEAGDEVLLEVAHRIRSCLRGSDTPARIGGDEFACLLAEVGGERGALAVAHRISEKLSSPFELGDRTLHVDAQIGVSLYPDHAPDFEGLLAAADRAMYRTKVDGNPAIEVYSALLDQDVPDEIAQEEELREAIEQDQLTLHYQPVIRVSDGALVGAEALVRWNHPARGLLDACDFIRLAERCGVIRQLDAWVREEVFKQATAWENRESPEWISINQSIGSLRDPEITSRVEDLLRRSPVPAGRIVLEVNEGVAVKSPEPVAGRLAALQKLGIKIALDDFGTGQSTLAYIKHFPADIIKLDGFFVHDLGTNYDSRNLVKAVIQMGRALGVTVIAEKVETEMQLDWLRSAGCDLVQGFFTGRPVPAGQLLGSAGNLAAPEEATPWKR
jgi:diguanylate cyclase (GGDEF)-like protein/PAS domain S-box-containing protein